jgi:hypothetical protein
MLVTAQKCMADIAKNAKLKGHNVWIGKNLSRDCQRFSKSLC